MDEVALDIEMGADTSSEAFVRELYETVKLRNHREGPLYPSDFFYEMFLCNNGYWWLPLTHPIAEFLIANDVEAVQGFSGKFGNVAVFTDAEIRKCRDWIVENCKKYKLDVVSYVQFSGSPPVRQPHHPQENAPGGL